MPLPIKDYALQVLSEKERALRIYRAVHKAWKTTVAKYTERGNWRRSTTFRSLVWEAAISELGKLSLDDPDFKVIGHKDTVSFILEDAIFFRFKHADMALVTSNFPTAEASSFDDHDVDLYGYGGLQRIELCYILDEFETKIVWVGFAARSKGEHLWKIEMNEMGIVVPTEELALDETVVDTRKLARIKDPQPDQIDKKKQDKGKGG